MTHKHIFKNARDLMEQEGVVVGPSDWMKITQERINLFADATGDHQWIHVDLERAKEGPFGKPIAHGYLTLSLASKLIPEIVEVENISMAVNYGTNKVRFIHPVVVGARIRALGEFIEIKEVPGGYQTCLRVTIEIEGEAKPACIVDTIARYYE